MNGIIRKTIAGLCLGSGLASLGGCYVTRQIIDPCYPQRYQYVSRHSLYDTFNAQAQNGHELDQTVWNYHFDVDENGSPSDRLNPMGKEKLKYLVRHRPAPDPRVFLQTANDLQVPANTPIEKLNQMRKELDLARRKTVQDYLAGLMQGRSPTIAFEVAVHDPAPVGINSAPILGNQPSTYPGALPTIYNNAGRTVTPVTVSSSMGSTGGAGGAGGGGGGGTGGN